MKFPKKLSKVFKSTSTPPAPTLTKLKDSFIVEGEGWKGEGWVKVIVPLGGKVDSELLTQRYGDHRLVKLSPCLFRLEIL